MVGRLSDSPSRCWVLYSLRLRERTRVIRTPPPESAGFMRDDIYYSQRHSRDYLKYFLNVACRPQPITHTYTRTRRLGVRPLPTQTLRGRQENSGEAKLKREKKNVLLIEGGIPHFLYRALSRRTPTREFPMEPAPSNQTSAILTVADPTYHGLLSKVLKHYLRQRSQ